MQFSDILGNVVIHYTRSDEELLLYFSDSTYLSMSHVQDCCETVYLDDVVGNLDSLLFKPILRAEFKSESARDGDDLPTNPLCKIPEYLESCTWSFYTLATVRGYVDLRWIGESNGYYSESVDLHFTTYDISTLPNFDCLLSNYPELII